MSLSNANVLPGDFAVQPFSSLLPTVKATDIQVALRQEGRGGRTAREIDKLRQESMNAGYDAGYAKGLELGMAEGHQAAYADAYQNAKSEEDRLSAIRLASFQSDLEQTVASVLSAMEEWTMLTEEKVTNIVIDICRAILTQELAQSRESVLGVVRKAIGEVTHSESARIRINPFDAESMQAHRDSLISAAQSIRNLEFVEDRSITGGCVIETDGGIVDATLEGQLGRLQEELDQAA